MSLALHRCHPTPVLFPQRNLTPPRGRYSTVPVVAIYHSSLYTRSHVLNDIWWSYVTRTPHPVDSSVTLHVHYVGLALNASAFRQQCRYRHSVRCHRGRSYSMDFHVPPHSHQINYIHDDSVLGQPCLQHAVIFYHN